MSPVSRSNIKTAESLVISIVTRFSFYSKSIKLFSAISILHPIFHLKGCKKGVEKNNEKDPLLQVSLSFVFN